ncbi:unnamed protein product [Phyllotreta striolata]|uniref:Carboxylic ester hydrolase n=1 Tax=Phyllotreta striolata TaxID=444603 RepID=A0A9N9TWS0_PHYSR|nr:unnamed protein product [Phyllotreta striolata]
MEGPVVETIEGQLRGCVRKNLDGEEFYCFLGVPYAQPPIGNLRFKDPQPLKPWTGIKDATKEGQRFYQKDNMAMSKTVCGTEDGLHLNVFTKKPIPTGSKNPVMVWIHGGGFKEGRNNTDIYGPEFLMLENVVLVTINYRLGILGSLKLNDPSLEVHGNTNLKDQVAALEWVRRNIGKFGGDAENVTIFGESAGGASVHYLTLSPVAEGLFHKAIMQSGVVLNRWAYCHESYLEELKMAAGKSDASEADFLAYLRELTVEEVFELQEKIDVPIKGQFSPIQERPHPAAFLTKNPLHLVLHEHNNKVPILMGYCSNEFLIGKALQQMAEQEKQGELQKLFSMEFVLSNLLHDVETSIVEKFIERMKKIYGESEADQYQFLSDAYFAKGILHCAGKYASGDGPAVYLYRLSLDSGQNYTKRMADIKDEGVCHMDDLGYLFKTETLPFPEKNTPEYSYVKRFVKLWTNFAKYGNPTPNNSDFNIIWEPVKDEKTINYLDIDKQLTKQTIPKQEIFQIWEELYDCISKQTHA